MTFVRSALIAAALSATALLGGCYYEEPAYPSYAAAYPGYSYYDPYAGYYAPGYGYPGYYAGPTVGLGFGFGGGHEWHEHHGWHGHHWH